MEIKLGQIVESKAGRDAGRKFLVTKVEDDSYVFLCDGDLRKIDKQKKKKKKHITASGFASEEILNKLENGKKLSNSEIRKLLAHKE